MKMLKVYNTLTRSKEEFVPLEQNNVRMYVCGPTVYDYPHIGNARSFAVFDTIRRYLEYTGYRVTYLTNYTDVIAARFTAIFFVNVTRQRSQKNCFRMYG